MIMKGRGFRPVFIFQNSSFIIDPLSFILSPMRLLPAIALPFLLGSSLFAQTAPPIDAKSMLESLQDIKQKADASAKSQLVQTISDFTAACADDGAALNFYLEAVRVTRFVGQPHEDSAFRDWKKEQIPRLRPSAIRTTLRYTMLSLQRAAGATDDQVFPVLLAYAEDTEAILPSLEDTGGDRRQAGDDHDLLRQAVSDNIFARWYNIGPQLSDLDEWEPVPGNIDGIYEKLLLPYMRKTRDPRILRYWDNKIISERGAASTATAAFSTDRFNLTRRPSLLWSRAEDEVAIGMRDQGITDMFNLVKAFPSHPDAGKWIPELQGLLTAAAAPAAPAQAGAAAAPAPAAPAAPSAPLPPSTGPTPIPGT
jgi:hypothetical protein